MANSILFDSKEPVVTRTSSNGNSYKVHLTRSPSVYFNFTEVQLDLLEAPPGQRVFCWFFHQSESWTKSKLLQLWPRVVVVVVCNTGHSILSRHRHYSYTLYTYTNTESQQEFESNFFFFLPINTQIHLRMIWKNLSERT